MKIKPKQYAIALYESIFGLSLEKADIVAKNFINFLAKNSLKTSAANYKLFPKIRQSKRGDCRFKNKNSA